MISRDILEDPLYLSEKFTRMQAFLDLCFMASFKERTFYIRGNKVSLQRGQIAKSVRFLAERWQWSVNTVTKYLDELKKGGYIDTQKTSVNQIITIKKCLIVNTQDDTQDDTQNKTQDDTQTDTYHNKDNKVNKEKKEKKEIPSSLRSDGLSSETDDEEKINDFNALVSFFNEIIDKHNSCIPKIRAIENNRRKAVNARVREYGRKALVEVFSKAATSDYLNGKNSYSFVASFDWLIRPNNFPKVLEGNYNDRDKQGRQKEKVDEKMAVGQILTPTREEWGKFEVSDFFKNKR